MTQDPEAPAEPRELLGRTRQLERERNALVGMLVLLLGLLLVNRVGERVYAIAVWDAQHQTFVERAYLTQQVQADQVLSTLVESARRAHPFYKDAPADFKAALPPHANPDVHPEFVEPVTIRRVRRVTALGPGQKGVDMPVERAVEALRGVLHVQVRAVCLYDVEKNRPLLILPNEGMLEEAKDARLDNIGRRVADGIRAPDYLVEKPRFVQPVKNQMGLFPLDQVMTVQQAVDFLSRGGSPAMHTVQTGEKAPAIAAKYNATVADLAQWNPGRDLDLLRVGDQVVVRRAEPPLTVLTVERRTVVSQEVVNGKAGVYKFLVEIRRHDGEIKNKIMASREQVG